jgi:hypothetical protein
MRQPAAVLLLATLLVLALALSRLAAAFVPKPSPSSSTISFPHRWHMQQWQQQRSRPRAQAAVVEMRDASMVVDVAVGDRVKIKPGVVLDGRDWGGLEGTVAYTWEKCEVSGVVAGAARRCMIGEAA